MKKSLIHCLSCALAAVLLLGACSKEAPVDDGNNLADLIVGRWDMSSAIYMFGGQVLDVEASSDGNSSFDKVIGLEFAAGGKVGLLYDTGAYTYYYFMKESKLVIDYINLDVLHIDEKEFTCQEYINRMPFDPTDSELVAELKEYLVPVEMFCGKQVYEDKNTPGYYFLINGNYLLQCWRLPDGKGFYDGFRYGFVRKN